MEPRDRAAARLIWRFRLAAVSLALGALAFVQAPGLVVADTKLDLAVDPGGFLDRALTMWDPTGAFGQVQNQAYGYLFPMGPFFWGGHLAHVDPWVIQRLWWALLLVTAFLGVVKLCSALGIGYSWARIVAGLAYALSPRILSVIGPSSIEVWPMALAPWVLVPLVIGAKRGDPRRMAALSAVAVACVGGVNAAATFAVIPLGALWLLLLEPSRRRRSMMAWWPLFVLLGTMWWLVPLVLIGRYSPPFLDYIESASTTTFAATVFDALRGTTDWVSYVDGFSVAGNDLLTTPLLVLNGAVVLVLGLVGIAMRGNGHRVFLFSGLLLGLLLVTLGHVGATTGWDAPMVQRWLDGVLAPLRNTHKFDLVIRIPLVLGLAHVLSLRPVTSRAADRRVVDPLGAGLAVLALAGLAGATAPAWGADLPQRAAFLETPRYWSQTAHWLESQDSDQRALVVPASGFGNYLWGRTGDEVLQPLAQSPWAVRNAIPLAPGGNIRTLDAIEQRLASGEGTQGFADYLRRSGIGYLVVRNDLAPDNDNTELETVYATLRSTPGVSSVAAFGPQVGGPASFVNDDDERVFIDDGRRGKHRAVEVFEVQPQDGVVSAQSYLRTAVVAGGPESLLEWDEHADGGGTPAILADDLPRGALRQPVILTDGDRRREAAFGRARDNRSSSLAADEPYSLDRPVHDYRVSDRQRFESVPRLVGAKRIRASSAASEASAPDIRRGEQPWSAFDSDPRTAWSATTQDAGQESWIEVDLDDPIDPGAVSLTLGGTSSKVVTVTTDTGSLDDAVQAGDANEVTVPSGETTRIRFSAPGTTDDPLSIRDITIPGVELSRPLVLPDLPEAWGAPEQIVLASDAGRSGCVTVDGIDRCTTGGAEWGEDGRVLDRVFSLNQRHTYPLRMDGTAVAGSDFDAFVQRRRLAAVRASSYADDAVQNSVVRTVDGDPRTGWIADRNDLDPTLTLSWLGKRSVDALEVTTNPTLAASVPQEATLRFSGGREREVVLRDGVARFKPIRADYVEVHLENPKTVRTVGASGDSERVGVGVSEISVPGTSLFPQVLSELPQVLPCGSGPTLTVDGERTRTRVSGSEAEMLSGSTVGLTACSGEDLFLRAGVHRITVAGNDEFRPVAAVLGANLTPADSVASAPTAWGSVDRTVRVQPGAYDDTRLLAVPENENKGWQASPSAESVQVNGWQQGWLVSGTDSEIRLTYAPAATYRAALAFGALLFLVPVLMAVPRRRPAPQGRARSRAVPAIAGLVSTVIVAGIVASTWGAVAVALGWLASAAARRTVGASGAAWLVALPLGVAAMVYFVRPWGSADGWAGDIAWVQAMAAGSVGVAGACVFGPLTNRFRRRIEGRSTSR